MDIILNGILWGTILGLCVFIYRMIKKSAKKQRQARIDYIRGIKND